MSVIALSLVVAPRGAAAQLQATDPEATIGLAAGSPSTCPKTPPPPTPTPVPTPSPTPNPSATPSPSPTPSPVPTPTPTPTPYIPPGIDISHNNGSVNFTKIAAAGLKFTYVKATQSTTTTDEYYAEHVSQAMAMGLAAGAYHFFDYRADGLAQADFFVDTVLANGGFDAMLPPVLDVECLASYGVNDPAYADAQIHAFASEVYLRTGRMIAIYTSQYMWRLVSGADTSFGAYPLWVACWNCSKPALPAGWKTWVIWQDGQTKIPGIKSAFDGDIFNGVDEGVPLLLAHTNRSDATQPYALSATVHLDLSGRDGVAYRVSTDGVAWSDWVARPTDGIATIDLGPDGPKTLMVQLQDPFGNASPASVEPLIVDTTGPLLTTPATALRLGRSTTPDGGVPASLIWSAVDSASGLASATLTGACGTAAPISQTTGPSDPPTRTLNVNVKPGDRCSFGAQATDNAGHASTSAQTTFSLALREQTQADTTWTGHWTTVKGKGFSGGSMRSSTSKGATATFHFTGTDVALVTSRGPARGKLKLLVDGVAAPAIDLYAAKNINRQVVFTWHFAVSGPHTLRLQVPATRNSLSKGKRVDVDAFLVLTP